MTDNVIGNVFKTNLDMTEPKRGKHPLTKAINKAMNNEYQIAEWIKQFLK